MEISLNDLVCESIENPLGSDSKPLRSCSLEDIIAEKLRALLQQIPLNRSRPQDVFDIATMSRKHSEVLDTRKIGLFLLQKSEARQILATKQAFDAGIRDRAEIRYEAEIRASTPVFLPFKDAWIEVLDLITKTDIDDY